jgi:hypothetical protein
MSEFADVLAKSHAAVRVRFSWLGVRRALDEDQKGAAAEVFGAATDYLGASKKLLDTKHEAVKAVTAVKGEIGKFYKNCTLPFPEDGVRLLKRERLSWFNEKMKGYVAELDNAAAELQLVYEELREKAKVDLGELFDEDDYPETLEGKFQVSWHLVNTSPPDYLKETMPGLYAVEQERIARQMEAAVSLAEQSFAQEFAKMVKGLADQLQGKLDGKVKRFSGGYLKNIKTFFERFKDLDLGSDQRLGELVEQAQQVCDGITLPALKDSEPVQTTVKTAMDDIGKQLSEMVELRPAREVSFDDEE